MNWRDPWHPAAGGAEQYAWEISRRLAGRGARVHFVTCRAPGQPRRNTVDGVVFHRMGGRFTLYPLVLCWMLLRRRGFDAVIDCQNGIPFFTPWVLPRRVPVFCAMHHVHDEQFGVHFPAVLAWIGRFLEGPVTRWSYRRHACTAVSLSTDTALRERLRWRGPVYIVPNGVTAAKPDGPPPAGSPSLVCVSRLVPHKRVERLLDLAEKLRPRWPALRVHVVGRGPSEDALRAQIEARGLGDVVIMHGYLADGAKAALVAGADLHLQTSQGEGWGLCVVEAAALGVPTVAPDVDGLREAVRDGVTGWIAQDSLTGTVEQALRELADPVRRDEMAWECRRWAGAFDWERTASRMESLLVAAIRRGSSHGSGEAVVTKSGEVVEGPLRDEQDEAAMARQATPLERLLGRTADPFGNLS